MATKRVITICQSGGEFVKNKDGTLSYNGGEAYAIDIDEQTQLSDFKKEVAENFDCDVAGMIVKYFLPGNKRTLITVSKDKDLTRMVNFVGDSSTVDVFIITEQPLNRNASHMPPSRSSRTTVSETVTLHDVDAVVENDNDEEDDNDDMPVDTVTADLTTFGSPSMSSRVNMPHKAAQQWENVITGVDQRFNSFNEFREALHKYSIAHGFSYRYKKNDSHRVTVKCKLEGCKWRIYASRLATTQLICIKRMSGEHSCGGIPLNFGSRATRSWIGSIIKEKLKTAARYRPKDIAEDVQKELGIQMNYSQAWRVKEIAKEQLQGSYKESYARLPLLCERIKETNPGSIATLTTKEDSSFHRLFLAFHASIIGFQQGCRPLIFLDCAPLNSKYQGDLLAAISADGEDGVFPICFAIVDVVSTDNWRWFLEELKSALSLSEPVTFVADFQNGLKETLLEVFCNAHHSYCLRYMAEKLNKDLKGQFSHEARRLMVNDFYAAAYATKLEDFQHSINNLKAISIEAYDWVLKNEPKYWANAFFEGARYNLLTTNFGQLLFSWVSEGDELPIKQMIDLLQGKMRELIDTRRMESNQWSTRLTPSKEEKLEKEILNSQSLQIFRSQGYMFEVHGESLYIVDINNFDCSCKEWQLTGLPCCHAIAVFRFIDRNSYDFCSKYFMSDRYRLTYAGSIQSAPDTGTSEEAEGNQTTVTVTPPPSKRHPGRPKTKPAESEIGKRQLQCSKCKGLGHNKKTCKSS